ncbi:MAG TPA: methionyl-tRNA formyltransferase [Actinomycetota bacterium]|nr:methionyl-tRNA formyltransferase [Actinomycetota bacterium]
MRVAFLGNDPWSVPPLESLAGSTHELVLVVTRDPRPAGRGGKPRATPVAERARAMSLPVLETPTVKRGPGLDALKEAAPDILAVVAYGEILPSEVLRLPRVAPVNVHFSLLPALRGADPVRRAILDGLEETGVTTMRMDEGMDTGPVLLQSPEPIRPEDTAGSLGDRLAAAGGRLLVDTLDRLEKGDLHERPQDDAGATMAPKLKQEEEWIDWTEDAESIGRRVRALAPDPGARTRFRDRVVKVLGAAPVDAEGVGAAGTVLRMSKRELVVAAGRGAVSVDEVVPEGRKPMTGADFARGARPEVGERFG